MVAADCSRPAAQAAAAEGSADWEATEERGAAAASAALGYQKEAAAAAEAAKESEAAERAGPAVVRAAAEGREAATRKCNSPSGQQQAG